MRIGLTYPQTELAVDPGSVASFVHGVAAAGYDHLVMYDHVLGADPAQHPEGPGLRATGPGSAGWAYTNLDAFHEPLVFFGFLAGLLHATGHSLELATGVLVLPQRQTALVAKQAAEVDVLTGGRLRLGVGLGWNAVEYEGLGRSFTNRGRRIDEQIALLRQLWTEPVVTFDGDHDRVTGAGILPLPVQRPIPVWMGARPGSPAMERVGRLADGLIALGPPSPELDAAWQTARIAAERAGRDPDGLGLEGRVQWGDGDLGRIRAEAGTWREWKATHLSVITMRAGLRTVGEHVDAFLAAKEVLDG